MLYELYATASHSCFVMQARESREHSVQSSERQQMSESCQSPAEVSGRSFDFLAAGARGIWRAELRKVEAKEVSKYTSEREGERER